MRTMILKDDNTRAIVQRDGKIVINWDGEQIEIPPHSQEYLAEMLHCAKSWRAC